MYTMYKRKRVRDIPVAGCTIHYIRSRVTKTSACKIYSCTPCILTSFYTVINEVLIFVMVGSNLRLDVLYTPFCHIVRMLQMCCHGEVM